MGLKLPVKFDGSTSNIELDDVQMKKDFVYVLLKAICTEDDQVRRGEDRECTAKT